VCYRTVVADQWFRQMATADRARPYYYDAKRYLRPAGLRTYGDMFALLFAEHAARYGTERHHLGALAIAARNQASRHDNAVLKTPLTIDEYLLEPPLTGVLSRFDHLVQVDGSVAVVVTTADRAADLTGTAVPILAVAESGGAPSSGYWELAPLRPDPMRTAAGAVADRLYGKAGVTASDIDVTLLYDCTTVCELMVLEEYGLIARGEPDAVLTEGFGKTVVPVNPHGGNLAGGYVHGFSQVAEAVRQMRGEACNQVRDAELALIAGPPSNGSSGAILGRAEQ
jgi:acetyl-CoA acetyltransferase